MIFVLDFDLGTWLPKIPDKNSLTRKWLRYAAYQQQVKKINNAVGQILLSDRNNLMISELAA